MAPVLLLALIGCRDWREKVVPGLADADPLQEGLPSVEPITYEVEGFGIKLTPRAHYRITGYVVETSRKLLDRWDFVVPMDVAMVWGPIADPAVLKDMSFHLSGRYASWRWKPSKPGQRVPPVEEHMSNNHLIPSTTEVSAVLGRVDRGDLLTLEGRLVDLEVTDGAGAVVHRSRTSVSRADVGSGACEQLWVEGAEIARGEAP